MNHGMFLCIINMIQLYDYLLKRLIWLCSIIGYIEYENRLVAYVIAVVYVD